MLNNRKYGVHVIKNKKILLIGPSENVEKDLEELGDQRFDLVVRINHHYKNKIDNYDTNIVYSSFHIDFYNEDDIKYFKDESIYLVFKKNVFKRRKVRNYINELFLESEFDNYVTLNQNKIVKKINRLTTGNFAILNLLSYRFKELHIVGFDFYKTLYNKKINGKSLISKYDSEYNFLKKNVLYNHPNLLEQKYLIRNIIKNNNKVFCYGSTKEALEEIPMITAFIPLRGGSKSIPNKNIKDLNGKPLAQWVINSANNSNFVNNVVISTDSEEIGKTLKNCEVFIRSADTATDTATSESALLEFCKGREPNDIIVFLQATSPLLKTSEINKGIEKVLNGYDSAVSVVRQKRFIWNIWEGEGHPNYDLENRPRRQDWEGFLVENGAFYISSVKNILNSKCRVSGRIALIECSEESYYEIDEPSDWNVVEGIINARQNK